MTAPSSITGRVQQAATEILPGLVTVGLLLAAWEIFLAGAESPYYPSLGEIWDSFVANWFSDRISADLIPSMERLFIGYGASVILGLALGLAIGMIAWLRRLVTPPIEFFRSLPSTALVPFAIVAFGIGLSGKLFLIIFASIWPVLLNVVSAVTNIDRVRQDAARVYRLPLILRLRKVVIPSAMPEILAGSRTSLGIALIMVVVSEMFASTNGIGHFVVQAERTFRLTDMWSGVVLIGVLGYVLNAIFLSVENVLLRSHGPEGGSE